MIYKGWGTSTCCGMAPIYVVWPEHLVTTAGMYFTLSVDW